MFKKGGCYKSKGHQSHAGYDKLKSRTSRFLQSKGQNRFIFHNNLTVFQVLVAGILSQIRIYISLG